MKNFFTQLWVQIIAWIAVIIGTAVLLIGGTEVGNINQTVQLVFGIVEAVGLLIIFIKKMLQKKDTTNK